MFTSAAKRSIVLGMKITILYVIASTLLTVCCGAQQSTIKQVYSNSNSATPSANLPNIGQSQHLLEGTVTQSGGTCNTVVNLALQASFDQSTWFNIGQIMQLDYTNSILQQYIFANGVYPFIRVTPFSGFASACHFTVWYTGTVTPFSFPQSAINTTNYRFNSATAAAGGSTVIVTNTTGTAFAKPVVYGMTLSNIDSTNDTLIELYFGTGVGCGTGTGATGHAMYIGAKQSVVLPPSDVPYWIGAAGGDICATSTASAGSPSTRITVTYRFE